MAKLSLQGNWFVDTDGRKLLLRGVNLGGSSKLPYSPSGAAHIPWDMKMYRDVSFVNRPFPISDAPIHFERLQSWGFNLIRLLVPWEAIEHQGPGMYDEDYLAYITEIVRIAGEYGFYVFIDPHQDVWSRFSGGDGAPAWTLKLAGFELEKLDLSEAAVTMQGRFPDYGKMVWPANRHRLASATMFSLFFGGESVAPFMTVKGESIQSYLQSHFLSAFRELALRVKDFDFVLGYDSLNEPSAGYLGVQDLNERKYPPAKGPALTWFESIYVPSGFSVEVPIIDWDLNQAKEVDRVILNSGRESAWQQAGLDIWRTAGVWELDAKGDPELVMPDYFADFSFAKDGMEPFLQKYAQMLQEAHPGSILFYESDPTLQEKISLPEGIQLVNANHWYDLQTLHTRRFDPSTAANYFTGESASGKHAVKKFYIDEINALKNQSKTAGENIPTLIGEFGVPFDLLNDENEKPYAAQIDALDFYYDLIDHCLVHSALWNYTSDNENKWGDQWNQEDLSIFSKTSHDFSKGLNQGGRAIAGFCRPRIVSTPGEIVSQFYELETGEFSCEVCFDKIYALESVFYIPAFVYGNGYLVEVSSGEIEKDSEKQQLFWENEKTGLHTISVRKMGTP